ncbi:MAG TPA: SDR family oxidoreductase [Gaiellaceae bacterium]|nr:SDR family oxidoreductase [Gaiellaceae bacterium]
MGDGAVVIVGGTSGLGRELAGAYAATGRDVTITGRDAERCEGIASAIDGGVGWRAFDLAEPERIGPLLDDVGRVDRLVLAAIERDQNSVADYDVARAVRLVTLKLVGYTEVVHALRPKLTDDASILLFGGQALRRPYPGSTTVTTVNGGVAGLVETLASELAPIRVNAIHPGIVGDSPEWSTKREAVERTEARTLIGRTVTMDEIVGASMFLLENGGVNALNLVVDGGWRST